MLSAMKPLTRRTLDWMPQAPVVVTRSVTTSAPPEVVWKLIADHEGWPDWFDGLTEVEPMEPPEGVGGHRRVHLGPIVVEEEFLAWEPGSRFAFVVTHANRRLMTSMVEDVRLTPAGEGTEVSYTQAVEPRFGFMSPLLRRAFGRTLDKGLAGLAATAEGRPLD